MKKSFVAVALSAVAVISTGCMGGSGGDAGDGAADGDKPSYTITYVEDQPDWQEIPTLDIDHQQWTDPVDIKAYAQLCYSDDELFVHMWADEENIRAEHPKSDPLGHTYEDSCLEFFFSPVTGDERYMNFEYNPNCCVCIQIGKTKEDRIRMAFEEDIFNARSSRIDGGWEIEYSIPFDFLRNLYTDFEAVSGEQIYGNFYKGGNLTVQKHYISWSPVDSEEPNFHSPQDFGVLIFE